MCLHIELALLDVLLQMSVSLILCSSQLLHRLSNCIECNFQCRSIQCYMRCLHYNRSHWSGEVLEDLAVLVHQEVQGSSIVIRGSSTIRRSSTIRGSSSIKRSFSRISSSSRRSSIPIRYLPLSGCLPF